MVLMGGDGQPGGGGGSGPGLMLVVEGGQGVGEQGQVGQQREHFAGLARGGDTGQVEQAAGCGP